MRTDILEDLASKLRALEVELAEKKALEQFNMISWVTETSCGTAACAIGWAGIRGWFKPWGMTIEFPDAIGMKRPIFKAGRRRSEDYREALGLFFDIENDQTIDNLFIPETYPNEKATPGEVADRIERLIELGEQEFDQWVQKETADG